MESPRPVPPKRRAMELSAWAKGWKRCSWAEGGMPIPGVPHGKSRVQVVQIVRFEIVQVRNLINLTWSLHTDLDFAALRELDGVAGQIEQDLLQSHPVADERIRRLLRHAAGEAQPVLAGPHGKDLRHLVQHPPQAEGGRFQFQFARLDLGGVQQVVQQRQEQVGRSLGGLQAVLDRWGRGPWAGPGRSCPGWHSWACGARGSYWPGTGSWPRWRPRRRPWPAASVPRPACGRRSRLAGPGWLPPTRRPASAG